MMKSKTAFVLILVVCGTAVVTGSFQGTARTDSASNDPTTSEERPIRPQTLELIKSPKPDHLKAEYRQMPVELLLRISQLRFPNELDTLRPPMEGPMPVSISVWINRPYSPTIQVHVFSESKRVYVRGADCRVMNRQPPGEPYGWDPEMVIKPSIRQCELWMSPEVGWPKIRRLVGAMAEAYQPPLPIDPSWGVALTPIYPYETMGFGVQLKSSTPYEPYPILKYAADCKVSDPACLPVWEKAAEEFWLPLRTRYPWLPEPGAPEWDKGGYISEKKPEGKRYRATSPIIDCLHLDMGRMTAREQCTPDSHWTEADEKQLKETIAREKNQQNKPPPSSSDK